LRLVNTIDEARKKLLAELESLEFEEDILDTTPVHYDTHGVYYIEVVGGRLYVSGLHKESGRRGRLVVSNLDLERLFILAQELLARREKLKLKVGDTAKVLRCRAYECRSEAKALFIVDGRVFNGTPYCPQHLEEAIKWAAVNYPSSEYRIYSLDGEAITSGYARDLSKKLNTIMEAVKGG